MSDHSSHNRSSNGSYSVENAQILWKNGNIPTSKRFGDVYYPPEGPIESSRHVFLEGNHLQERWFKLRENQQDHFVIGEIGFGTGLNFLLSTELWHTAKGSDKELYYISSEGFPLKKEDLIRALKPFSELSDLAATLIEQYPTNLRGHHRLYFPEYRITLDLLFDEALSGLKNHSFKADAWFLDGFSPELNRELWETELCKEIAHHSYTGTTFATFSAAGWVRRNLSEVGFSVEKFSGFKGKRESARGVFRGGEARTLERSLRPGSSITVIGAGLSGVSLAHGLGRRGYSVTLLEEKSDHTQGASGNPRGAILPYISRVSTIASQYYLTAFGMVQNYLRGYDLCDEALFSQDGALHFLPTERLRSLYELLPTLGVPLEIAEPLSPKDVSRFLGGKTEERAIHYPLASALNPRSLAHALLHRVESSVTTHYDFKVDTVEESTNGRWIINRSTARPVTSDVVIFANAYSAIEMNGFNWLPLEPVRGQLATFAETERSRELHKILCYDGYIIPAVHGEHLIGSTYEHGTTDDQIRREDTIEICERLKRWVPTLDFTESSPIQERVSFRTSTRDRSPLVGPMRTENTDRLDQQIYCSTGFGSRGLTSILPSADLLVSQLLGHPLPFSHHIHSALNPLRFWKNKVSLTSNTRRRSSL